MFEKLIRDNIPNIQQNDYPLMITRRVRNDIEHIFFLLQKKEEEYDEFLFAHTLEEESSEAGDYLEVLDTLIYLSGGSHDFSLRDSTIHSREEFLLKLVDEYGFDVEYIFRLQHEKREKKGGFLEGIIWIKD